jgi:hypothetical protein
MFKSMGFDLDEVARLFRQKRVLELRGLGTRLIREASIDEDYAKAELGVIAYSLHKLETKSHIMSSPKWHIAKETISRDFESAKFAVQKNDSVALMRKLKNIIQNIRNIDSELGNYAQNIYEKAKVKQASLAFSFGLSIAQAADLTGADKKDLQSYIGFTKMVDEEGAQKKISERVSDLKNLLGV